MYAYMGWMQGTVGVTAEVILIYSVVLLEVFKGPNHLNVCADKWAWRKERVSG